MESWSEVPWGTTEAVTTSLAYALQWTMSFWSLQDPTPVCTPTVLERRKASQADDDAEDNEITLRLPPASVKNAVQRPKKQPRERPNLKKQK